jgi:hypothetical protein
MAFLPNWQILSVVRSFWDSVPMQDYSEWAFPSTQEKGNAYAKATKRHFLFIVGLPWGGSRTMPDDLLNVIWGARHRVPPCRTRSDKLPRAGQDGRGGAGARVAPKGADKR